MWGKGGRDDTMTGNSVFVDDKDMRFTTGFDASLALAFKFRLQDGGGGGGGRSNTTSLFWGILFLAARGGDSVSSSNSGRIAFLHHI